jgi:hypothetical protein
MQDQTSKLSHYEAGKQVCNNAILITGNGRSGTTIVGKLIHSMRKIEYVFEPPTLIALLPLARKFDRDDFRVLFETYCYDELLMGQITGRAFNFNRNDDSCIYLTKSNAEIERRLKTAWSKSSAVSAAADSRLLIKLPDVTVCLAALRQLYPSMTFIVTVRDPNSVIQSVLRKGWFKNETLERMDIVWPTQTPGFTTPFWVAPEDIDNWRKWPELERAGYYYIRIANGATAVEGVINVVYEQLVSTPDALVRDLAVRLGLEFGELTPRLISETYARPEFTNDWVAQLSSGMREKVFRVAEAASRGA